MTPTKRWFDALISQGWRRALFLLLCCAPLMMGIIGRFLKHRHWFSDYDAVACAGEKLAHGEDFYVLATSCSHGMQPSGYVYPPYVAQMFEAGAEAVGADAGSDELQPKAVSATPPSRTRRAASETGRMNDSRISRVSDGTG